MLLPRVFFIHQLMSCLKHLTLLHPCCGYCWVCRWLAEHQDTVLVCCYTCSDLWSDSRAFKAKHLSSQSCAKHSSRQNIISEGGLTVGQLKLQQSLLSIFCAIALHHLEDASHVSSRSLSSAIRRCSQRSEDAFKAIVIKLKRTCKSCARVIGTERS